MPLEGDQVPKQVVIALEPGQALLLSNVLQLELWPSHCHHALDRARGAGSRGPLSEQAQFICSYTEYPHFHLPLFNEA